MANWVENFVLIAIAVFGSSGFWAYVQHRRERLDGKSMLLLGLAHDRIIHVGMDYIERGWITKDEYEDFFKYLYEPYAKVGGNGLAEKVKDGVVALIMHTTPPTFVAKEEK